MNSNLKITLSISIWAKGVKLLYESIAKLCALLARGDEPCARERLDLKVMKILLDEDILM